jgi:hypothetical protein
VFEMAAPIESPAKCEVRSVLRFLNAKAECPVEIHKQIVAVYGDVMNRQNVTEWRHEFSKGRTDIHEEQRSGRPSLISDACLQQIEVETYANQHGMIRELHHSISEVSKTTIHEAVTEKLGYRKFVCMLDAQNVNGRSRNQTDGFHAEVSHMLHTGRR